MSDRPAGRHGPVRIGLRCDAGAGTGVGHLVRSVALAEELCRRGAEVVVLGDVGDLPWARQQLVSRGLPRHPGPDRPAELVAVARALRLDGVVVDSYVLDPACAGAVRDAGLLSVAIVDGDSRGQRADVYVDQNLDAELARPPLPAGAVRLAGLRYALLRDGVRDHRPCGPPDAAARTVPEVARTAPEARTAPQVARTVPRVLAFFGGTDAFGAAPVLARLLVGTGVPVDLTVVAGRPETAAALAAVAAGPGQRLTVIGPTDDLPRLVTEADLVVSAAGSSLWELLCLGAAAATVWVVDNQRTGYERVVARRLAVGLGRLGDLAGDEHRAKDAAERLAGLLGDPPARAALAARGWSAVDGRGRERVVDEMLRRLSAMR